MIFILGIVVGFVMGILVGGIMTDTKDENIKKSNIPDDLECGTVFCRCQDGEVVTYENVEGARCINCDKLVSLYQKELERRKRLC